MSDPAKLPYLLKLLDDESQEVQSAVLKEILSYGASLETELQKLGDQVNENHRMLIKDLLTGYSQANLREQWKSWFKIENEYEKVERAIDLLSEFQNGPTYPLKLKTQLDALAHELWDHHHAKVDPVKLADFLFKTKYFRGVSPLDYYNPSHSNLVHVIESRSGIPLSLALIYMLVGYRLGMNIEGCNFPGHFLARYGAEDGTVTFVDCFNGGRFLDEAAILEMNPGLPESVRETLHVKATPFQIVGRILHNLIRSYEEIHQAENASLMTDLLGDLEAESDQTE